VYIRYPNGTEASGEVLDVRVPERIVFTFGYASGKPIAPGSSRITIALDEDAAGTRLRLLHEFAEAGPRDEHVQGWRFQLSLFGNLVANEVFGNAAVMVDAWFEAWAVADAKAREDLFGKIVTPTDSVPRPFQPARRNGRSDRARGGHAALYAGNPDAEEGGRAALPGYGARRLDRGGQGREGVDGGHERFRVGCGGQDRIRDGLH
jgi:hypothetical protein